MIKHSDKQIRKKFEASIYASTTKDLTVRLVLGIFILSYFLHSDLVVRESWQSFYTRLLPLSISVTLLIFHLFSKQKYKDIKTKTYNVFLCTLIIMMYTKCIIDIESPNLASTTIGTLMIIFLISLEVKANVINSIIIFFAPTIVFLAVQLSLFDTGKEQYLIYSNIYPFLILGFAVNQIQNKLRYKNFKANFLLKKEKNKTNELYKKTKSMYKNLRQKNTDIAAQHSEIKQQHKYIMDSIKYAQKIQRAMLPSNKIFHGNFQDYFIYYSPRDFVSGDFYWAEKFDDTVIYSIADSTGHGVPGAMVSMLGMSLLNKITVQRDNFTASEIVEQMRREVKKSLKQTGITFFDETKDGMDLALCIINTKTLSLQFSGAYISLYICRENEIIKLKGDRQPVSIWLQEKEFTNHEFQLRKNDILYCFTDGYTDQLSEKGKKFRIKKFRELLLKNAQKSMIEQKKIVEKELEEWKGKCEQIDDILVSGVKI